MMKHLSKINSFWDFNHGQIQYKYRGFQGFHWNTNGKEMNLWQAMEVYFANIKKKRGDFPASHRADYEREQVPKLGDSYGCTQCLSLSAVTKASCASRRNPIPACPAPTAVQTYLMDFKVQTPSQRLNRERGMSTKPSFNFQLYW